MIQRNNRAGNLSATALSKYLASVAHEKRESYKIQRLDELDTEYSRQLGYLSKVLKRARARQLIKPSIRLGRENVSKKRGVK